MSGPWSGPDPYTLNKLIHHYTAGIQRAHGSLRANKGAGFYIHKLDGLRETGYLWTKQSIGSLFVLCPHICLPEGKEAGHWTPLNPALLRERLAWNEPKSNGKLELCKGSWYGTIAGPSLELEKIRFFRGSVWVGWERFISELVSAGKVKGETNIFTSFPLPKNACK